MSLIRQLTSVAPLSITLFVLASCGGEHRQQEFYVLATAENEKGLPDALAGIAATQGLNVDTGKATDDQGRTLHAIEAKGRWVRVWMQNMPVSQEPAPCQLYEVDPGQFVVRIEPRFWPTQRVQGVADVLRRDAIALGYSVRSEPAPCRDALINDR